MQFTFNSHSHSECHRKKCRGWISREVHQERTMYIFILIIRISQYSRQQEWWFLRRAIVLERSNKEEKEREWDEKEDTRSMGKRRVTLIAVSIRT